MWLQQWEFLCWFAVFSSCNCLPAEDGSWMDLIEGHSGWVKWTMRRLKAVLLAIVIVMAVFIMSVLAFYNVFKKPLKSHEFSGGGHWHRWVDCLRLLFDPLENPFSHGLTSSSCGVAMGKGFWGSCFDNCTDTLCLFPYVMLLQFWKTFAFWIFLCWSFTRLSIGVDLVDMLSPLGLSLGCQGLTIELLFWLIILWIVLMNSLEKILTILEDKFQEKSTN